MQNFKSKPYKLFGTYLLLTFYCFGAAMINEFVEYYAWADAGRYMNNENFSQWLSGSSKFRIPFLVLPMFINTILALLLIKYLPAQVPKRALWIVLACHALAWISTFVFQVPMEMQLSKNGFNAATMQRLLTTDWIRKTAFFIEIPGVIYMANKFILDKPYS